MRHIIQMIVDRFHVGTPMADVTDEIQRRLHRVDPSTRRKALAIARARHRANLRLYNHIMRG